MYVCMCIYIYIHSIQCITNRQPDEYIKLYILKMVSTYVHILCGTQCYRCLQHFAMRFNRGSNSNHISKHNTYKHITRSSGVHISLPLSLSYIYTHIMLHYVISQYIISYEDLYIRVLYGRWPLTSQHMCGEGVNSGDCVPNRTCPLNSQTWRRRRLLGRSEVGTSTVGFQNFNSMPGLRRTMHAGTRHLQQSQPDLSIYIAFYSKQRFCLQSASGVHLSLSLSLSLSLASSFRSCLSCAVLKGMFPWRPRYPLSLSLSLSLSSCVSHTHTPAQRSSTNILRPISLRTLSLLTFREIP